MVSLLKKLNSFLILVSILLAVLFGILTPDIFEPTRFLGTIFINLLKAFALPLICSALVIAIGGMGSEMGKLKSIARGAIAYAFVSEVIAISIALLLFNFFKPGVGVNPSLIQSADQLSEPGKTLSASDFALSVFPSNIFDSLAKFNLLPVVCFFLILGLCLCKMGKEANPVLNIAKTFRDACAIALDHIMLLAPIGIFSLVGSGIASSQASGDFRAQLLALANYVALLLVGLFLHGLWQLLLAAFTAKLNPSHIIRSCCPVFSMAFGTSSSVSTLPLAIKTAEELGACQKVTRLMLPVTATINIGGMMMYEVTAALFFTQVLGIELDFGQQILLGIACILGGFAAGGIPETSLVSLVMVFKTVNIPISAISILLPLDRILDRFRTVINIFGNLCGVLTVSSKSSFTKLEPGVKKRSKTWLKETVHLDGSKGISGY